MSLFSRGIVAGDVASPASDQADDPKMVSRFDHRVQFYENDDFLYQVVSDFLAEGLAAGEPLVAIVSETHRMGLKQYLAGTGLDVERLCQSGQLVLLDAYGTLSSFMAGNMPDGELFRARVGAVIAEATTISRSGRVRAYGEMVDLLWREGNAQATMRLEQLWNELGNVLPISLLCGYSFGGFSADAHREAFARIGDADTHAHVAATESFPVGAADDVRLREVTILQQRARTLEAEIKHREHLEHSLRVALHERKHAEDGLRAGQRELSDFFDNAAEGFHWVGPDGVILAANRAELQMLGYPANEYIGRSIADFHVDADVIGDLLTRLRANETIRNYEARLRHKDGSIRHVLIQSNALFRDGEFVHTRCSTRDISDRKRLENELRVQNEDLLRTVKFSELFVGILGHDLRNPLSAITTAASLVRRRSDSEKVAMPVARILNSAGRMSRMIDQLLDFARIRLGDGIPLDVRPTDLTEVCHLALNEFEDFGESPKVTFQGQGSAKGHWDPARLQQMVANLLGNAIIHGGSADAVTIDIDGTDSSAVVLEVRNAGVVPPEILPIVFEPFRSGANQKHQHSNALGLGLYISKQVVGAHHGTVDVKSSPAEGTRFIVRLPRRSPAVAPGFAEDQA